MSGSSILHVETLLTESSNLRALARFQVGSRGRLLDEARLGKKRKWSLEPGPRRYALVGADGPIPVLMATDVLRHGRTYCFREARMEAGKDWETDRVVPAGTYTLGLEGPDGRCRSFPFRIEVGRTTRLEVPPGG